MRRAFWLLTPGSWLLALALAASAAERPRFVSLRADEVNLRVGPGTRYPVEWVFKRKGLPLEVLDGYDAWWKVRDSQGTEGWVQQHLVDQRRSVIVTGSMRTLRAAPEPAAAAVAHAEPGVIASLIECRGAWCRIDAQGTKGWLERSALWGVLPDETIP